MTSLWLALTVQGPGAWAGMWGVGGLSGLQSLQTSGGLQ